jgi:hypothetical protein
MVKLRKDKALNFRVKKYLYDFLDDFVKDKPYDKTDILTKIVENFYLEYQKGNNIDRILDTEYVYIPIDGKTAEFLGKYAEECNCSVREMILNIIHYFFMGFLLGEFQISYKELKEKMSGELKDLNNKDKVKT